MKLSIAAGSTGETVDVFIQDTTKTDGSGLTGLVFNSAGLTCYYNFPRQASTAVTLATLASPTAAWSTGGFKEIDATNQPGKYRFDIPNALLASGNGRYVSIMFRSAANMAPLPIEIELTGWNNQDSAAGGMSRIDAAISSRMATFTLPSNFAGLVIDGSGNVHALDATGNALATHADASTIETAITALGSPLQASSYTAPANAAIEAAIAALGTPAQAGITLPANVLAVNNHTVKGSGTAIDPWGPA